MFWAAALGDTDHLARVDRAISLHVDRLSTTGLVSRDIERVAGMGGSLTWNSGSSHATTHEPSANSTAIFSGYVTCDSGDTLTALQRIAGGDHAALEGEFSAAMIVVHPERSSVHAFADPAGSHPVFYGQVGDRLTVSNDPHLIALSLGLDELSADAAYELLAFDHAVGRETTIRGVFRLYPGEILRGALDSGSSSVSVSIAGENRYHYPPHDRDDIAGHAHATYSALVDGIRSNPVLAADHPAVIGVSGGLDSRITASALAAALGPRADATTLDLSDDDELAFATRVASTLGFEHRVVQMEAGGVDDLRAGWLLSGGQVPVNAAAGNIVFYRTVGGKLGEQLIVIGAWPGDAMIGSYVPLRPDVVDSRNTRAAVRRWAQDRSRQWWSPTVARFGRSGSSFERLAIRKLEVAIQGSSGSTAAQKLSHWMTFSRPFSQLSPARLSSDILAVTPMLTEGYLRRIFELGGSDLLARNFYRYMIHHELAALGDIPTAPLGELVSPVSYEARAEPHLERVFALLPLAVKKWVRRLRGIHHGMPEGREAQHWALLMRKQLGDDLVTRIDSLFVDASRTAHVQVLGCLLALMWTRTYLTDGCRTLAAHGADSSQSPADRVGSEGAELVP